MFRGSRGAAAFVSILSIALALALCVTAGGHTTDGASRGDVGSSPGVAFVDPPRATAEHAGGVVAVPAPPFHDYRAVLIVGAEFGSDFTGLKEEGDHIAEQLKGYGVRQVLKYYTPDCTWSRVREGLQDANIVAYLGHGLGYDGSAGYNDLAYNGFYIDPDPAFPDGPDARDRQRRSGYIGEAVIQADVRLAPDAIVILDHACFAAGFVAGEPADVPVGTAQRRVQDYSSTFLEMGAHYYASNYSGALSAFFVDVVEEGLTLEEARDSYCWTNTKFYYEHPNGGGSTFSFTQTPLKDGGYRFGEAFAGNRNLLSSGFLPAAGLEKGELERSTPSPAPGGSSFDEYLLIANPGAADAKVRLEMSKPSGCMYDELTVKSWTRETVDMGEYAPAGEVSVRLLSDEPVAAERTMYFDGSRGSDGGSASTGIPLVRNDWYFAEGYTGGGFDEYLLVHNPGGNAVDVKLTLMRNDRAPIDYFYRLAPDGRWTVHVDEIPGFDDAEVSARITSGGGGRGVVAERSMYFDYQGVKGGHVEKGVNIPTTTWYFPEGYTPDNRQGRFDTYFLVMNPNPFPVVATFEFQREDGKVLSRSFSFGPNSRGTVGVDGIPGMESCAFATKVSAERPVVVERSMYFSYYGRLGGHCSAGLTVDSADSYFAEGYTAGGFDTYLLIQNPGDTGAVVDVTYNIDPGYGTPFSKRYGIPPHSRFTVKVDEEAGDAAMGLAVHSDRNVIAERSVYFDYRLGGGGKAEGGHNSFGTGLLDQVWYFAEGYTGK